MSTHALGTDVKDQSHQSVVAARVPSSGRWLRWLGYWLSSDFGVLGLQGASVPSMRKGLLFICCQRVFLPHLGASLRGTCRLSP